MLDTLDSMGETLRQRALRALGLANVWVQLEALSVRLRRVEVELEILRDAPPKPITLRAAPPPAPKEER